MQADEPLERYLQPDTYVDSDAPNVIEFAQRESAGAGGDVERAVRLYYAVRDGIVYTPYCDYRSPDTFRASACLARGWGFCVAKAALLAAAARAVGIPARMGFADVKNHLTTPRLREQMRTDVFYFHGYAQLHVGGTWVKATPAFDRGLCDRFGVRPLDWDGRTDALLHPYDAAGRRHMEYVLDRGPSADVPAAAIMETFERWYPGLTARDAPPSSATRFRQEAEATRPDPA